MTSDALEAAREVDLEILSGLRNKPVSYSLKRDQSPRYVGVVGRVGLDQLEMIHITWSEPSIPSGVMAREVRVYGTDQFSEIEVCAGTADEQRDNYAAAVRSLHSR